MDELIVFIMGMLPVVELRVAIPYGMTIFKMSAMRAFIFGSLGSIFAAVILLHIIPPLVGFCLKHSTTLERLLKGHFDKLHKKHSAKFNEIGFLFLVVFVAIPVPGTGAWTGSLLAYLFNIPYRLAITAISLGVIGAGLIITFFSGSIIQLWEWLTA